MMDKKINIKLIVFTALICISFVGSSQDIKISLFNKYSVKTLVFSVVAGEYNVIGDDEFVVKLEQKDLVYISLVEDFITMSGAKKEFGTFDKLSFETFSDTSVFSIKPVLPQLQTQYYDDNISMKVDFNRVLMVNHVNVDKYLAGVVEAEGGPNALPEYYKAQSLLCRTYAVKNMGRHIEEGFNLCDEVHCQAFKGRSRHNPEIFKATLATSGEVIIDKDSNLITAAFHANCGGQTTNSGGVWLVSKSYLVSVDDPYCANQRNSTWTKEIPGYKWKEYLKKKGWNISLAAPLADFEFYQNNRREQYVVGDNKIPFHSIRGDWNLKSAYFSVVPSGQNIILKGKGYGHGIGLCQIGAMTMARKGKTYKEMIDFYYKGVEIVESDQIEKQ